MTDKEKNMCCLCDREAGQVAVMVRATNGHMICCECSESAFLLNSRQKELAVVAMKHFIKMRGQGIEVDENDNCTCPKCTLRLLTENDGISQALLKTCPFIAEEVTVSGTKH